MLKVTLTDGDVWVGYHDELGEVIFDPQYDPCRNYRKDGKIFLFVTKYQRMVPQDKHYARDHLLPLREHAKLRNLSIEKLIREYEQAANRYPFAAKGAPPYASEKGSFGTRAYDPSSRQHDVPIFPWDSFE